MSVDGGDRMGRARERYEQENKNISSLNGVSTYI